MNPSTMLRTGLFVLLIATIAVGKDKMPPTYLQGTITKNFSGPHKSYELRGPGTGYQIADCGEFQTGQAVDYRVEDKKIYIRGENGKEYKCSIEATVGTGALPSYLQGTITGWDILYEYQRAPFSNHHKYYELKGAGTIYRIDCGPFRIGQPVDYRLEGDERIYIHQEIGEEEKCDVESAKIADGPKSDAPPTAAPTTPH